MRTSRRTSLVLVAGLLGSAAVSLTAAAPAQAAQTVTPTFGTTNAATSFVLSGVPAKATEAVTLKLTGHPDIAGTVTNPDAGPGCALGITDNDCGTSITVAVDITNAFPGVYDISRTQTPAGLGGTSTTAVQLQAFTLKSQPVVSSVNPATRGADSSSPVTITGKGFGPASQVSFGTGTVVSDVTFVNPTTLTATVAVSPSAQLGTRDVTVLSADNLTGTKAAAFTIAAAPTLTSIAPTSGMRGTTVNNVVLTGTGFVTGGDFAISMNGITATNPMVTNGGTTLTVSLVIADTAPSGDRTVRLTNADGGRARLVNGFRVIAAPTAPASVLAIPRDASATVAWSPPADPGSSPVTKYTITSTPATTPVEVGPTLRQVTMPGLTNGTPYTFDVVASNDDGGPGAAATTPSVTPKIAVNLTALSNRVTAISGQSAVIYGYLTRASTGAPGAGQTVKLKIAPSAGAQSVRSLVTDAHGRWSTTVALTYNTAFTASYAGGPSIAARTTPVLAVPVGTRIVVTSPASGATSSVASLLTVRGTVSPNKPGKQVGVYKVVNGVSTLIGKGTIASNGSYAANIKLPYGNYLLKVVLGPVAGNSTGTSAQFVVKRR
jgi:hypothetical protein